MSASRAGALEPYPHARLVVAALDTVIALAAGTVIFAVVFSYGLDASSGPALMLQTLPMLFARLPGGYFISLAFSLLVTFAAISSAISLLEVVVAHWVERQGAAR